MKNKNLNIGFFFKNLNIYKYKMTAEILSRIEKEDNETITETDVTEMDEVKKIQVKQIMSLYPKLDYLMAVMLVTTPKDILDKILKDVKPLKPEPDTSNIVKDAFYFEN